MTTWMLRKRGWYWRDVGLIIPVTIKEWLITIGQDGFVTLLVFSRGERSEQQASCGGGCRSPRAE